MSNRTLILVISLAALLLGGVFYWLRDGSRDEYDWFEDSMEKERGYSEKSVQPYGTHIMHEVLTSYFPDYKLKDIRKGLAEDLPESAYSRDNYVFIGEALFLDSTDNEHLLDFVYRGNTALISSKTIPYELISRITDLSCDDYAWRDYGYITDTTGILSLSLPDSGHEARYYYARKNVITSYNWHYFDQETVCNQEDFHTLGRLNGSYPNFVLFNYGEGRFLLHTTPIAFSNFSLLRTDTRLYAERAMSFLSEGNIYWDASSRVPESVGRTRNNTGDREETGILTYILKQKSLAWAWYLLLGTSLLWIAFRARRRQRVIPVLKPVENASYEFISTIADMHFQEKSYKSVSKQAFRHFLQHLRDRYGVVIHLNHDGMLSDSSTSAARLSYLSGISEAQILDIFEQYTAISRYEPTEQMMTDFYQALEAFMKNAS
jgi:hypothetical protein